MRIRSICGADSERPLEHRGRSGFTLMELLVVILIILIVSVLALPTISGAFAHRQVSEAGRLVQGALVGARDRAIHTGNPSGIRLIPDPVFSGMSVVTGQLDPAQILAYSRILPLETPPDYSEGAVSIYPANDYTAAAYLVNGITGCPALILEEAAYDASGLPLQPTSWAWNIRIGEKIQINQAGPWYTVVGPLVVPTTGTRDAQGKLVIPNAEQFVNYGPPGTASPLVRQNTNGVTYNPEYLILVNGKDDNQDGWVDNGFDGTDNNGNGVIDELAEWLQTSYVDSTGRTIVLPGESETWVGSIRPGLTNLPYTIRRRPAPGSATKGLDLPSNVVIDATGWNLTSPERSRLGASLNHLTGYADIMVNPDGTIVPTTIYSSPASVGIRSSFLHLWLCERADLVTPKAFTVPHMPIGEITTQFAANLIPYNGPRFKGDYLIVSLFPKSGKIASSEGTTWDNPAAPIIQFYPPPPLPQLPPPVVYDPDVPFNKIQQDGQ